MYMFAAINILLVAFVWFYIPETKNKTLETMDILFGGVNHAEKGVNVVEEEKQVQEIAENVENAEHDDRRRSREAKAEATQKVQQTV